MRAAALFPGAALCFAALAQPAAAGPVECLAAWGLFGEEMLPGLPHGSGPAERAAWRAKLADARAACRDGFNASASAFARDDLKWTQTSYVQPQMHPFDRYFYEPGVGYTVDRYLADVERRYGGVDSVLLWPNYPNIGVDSRNQIDLFRALPGGLPALRGVVDELKARGVRVLLPYNPWDTATRREGTTDAVAMAALVNAVHADGFNGDTMASVGEEFFAASPGIAIEPELMGVPSMSSWHTLGWAYWSLGNASTAPRVDFYKHSLDSRWMSHACERWSKNKTNYIQTSFFNGVGFVSWENVWCGKLFSFFCVIPGRVLDRQNSRVQGDVESDARGGRRAAAPRLRHRALLRPGRLPHQP